MATVVFSAIGQATAGAGAAAFGAFAGRVVDREIAGDPRAGAIAVQSSAYGDAIPRVYGTLRVAGGVIWSTGLKGEGSGDKLTGGGGRSYSINLAIGISARPIRGVGRIWADGKLIRDANGLMSMAGAVRIYTGAEDQAADPLIAAVEGVASAPAYRGLAYVVFENLQLADFANRVPQFGFEIFADAVAPTLGAIAADLFMAAGAAMPDSTALGKTVDGYGVGGSADLGGVLRQIALLAPHDAMVDGARLRLRSFDGETAASFSEDAAGAYTTERRAETGVWRREGAHRAVDLIEIGYFDPARDYQPGQQRATAARAVRTTVRHDLPVAMTASAARGVAERLAREGETARVRRTLALPYAHAAIEVGDIVRVDGDPRAWRVRRQALEAMVVGLELEGWADGAGSAAMTDAGRVAANPLTRQGPTLVRLLDLPAFGDDGGNAPRLWLALSGDAAWRAADVQASTNAGASYASLGVARARAIVGTTLAAMPEGPCDRWDERTTIDVLLANGDDWLTATTAGAVLGGANLAAIGAELIAFRAVAPTGPGWFRLSGLLRGRFGTEFAASGHAAGEPFTLLDRAQLFQADVGAVPLGASIGVRAVGPLEVATAVAAQTIVLEGANLRPFAPVRLRVARDGDGTIRASWTRRSRTGLGWADGTDAPVGEESERYAVTLVPAAGPARAYGTTSESVTITPAQQIAQTGALVSNGRLSVAQVSAVVGAGTAATRDI